MDDDPLARRGGIYHRRGVDEAEGIAAVEREIPDLVLLDFKLPDRTGVDVLREIRRISPEVPVILITAYGTVEGAVTAMREGRVRLPVKPF